MPSRPSRLLRRQASFVACAHSVSIQVLEDRRMMNAAPLVDVTTCTCAACSGARATAASVGQPAIEASVKPLTSLTKLSKSLRTAMTSAGAGLFTASNQLATSKNGQTDRLKVKSVTPFALNLPELKKKLLTAPAEFTRGAEEAPVVLALPMPDGSLQRFKVVRSEVMDPALARQFREIRTYRGVGIDDPSADIRLDTTPAGFHAQILSAEGSVLIEPYFKNDAAGTYVSFAQADAVRSDAWQCLVQVDGAVEGGDAAFDTARADGDFEPASITFGGTLKTYRAAVAGNRPYVVAATSGVPGGATVANGLAAIVTSMNRVTGIYESELSIRMTLVANNSTIVYGTDNPLADPYSNTSSAINQNTSNLNTRIGSANYDIGHVFTTASGGVAALGSVGRSNKGAGTTGTSNPVGDPFSVDYVAHEIGHQFGANHTFNTAGDTGNRNASTAYEPGSGVTIMGYAGLEGNDDLATNSIPYFHSVSIDEVRNYITTIPAVGTSTANGNNAPVVSAGANYVIPTGTPFALTANATDPDGDTLTYDWQQRDLGAATFLNSADNGTSPLFRPFVPSLSPTRVFPRLSSILAGSSVSPNAYNNNTYAGERLPTVARSAMKFRVIARDNRINGGGVSTSDMQVQVVNTGSAFGITSYSTAVLLPGGSTQTLNWNVAGTTGNGINVANVKISLSTNGGTTFPITLAENTANDGSEPIQMPYGTASSTARIKVEAIGNIFFDINNANFSISNVAAPASVVPGAPLLVAASDTGVSDSDGITRFSNVSAEEALTFSVPGTVAGATVEIIADNVVVGSAVATGTTTLVTTNGLTLLVDGTRPVTARQKETGKPISAQSAGTSITIDTVAPTLVSAADRFSFETGQSLKYTFADASPVSIGAPDITIAAADGTAVATSGSVSFDADTATFSYGSGLADGNYTATLDAGAITDVAGNGVATETTSFYVLAGDANRDRTVNFADLVILAQSYNQTGRTFSGGNFDYSADGSVNFADLVILAQRYNQTIAAPTVARGLIASAATPGKLKPRSVAAEVLI